MSAMVEDELANMPEGKRKLVVAALKIAARDGTPLNSLGLRELAREADLNHNTFYRHFEDLDDLARSTIELIAQTIIEEMRHIRTQARTTADATEGVVNFFLELVLKNPDAFAVGVRELNTVSSPLRPMLLKVIDKIAQQSVEQIRHGQLVAVKDDSVLLEVARDITVQMFNAAVPLLRAPAKKKSIAQALVNSIRRQFLGAMALESLLHPKA